MEASQVPKQVFISHASEDKPVAIAVCEALERACISCWIARDIPGGKHPICFLAQNSASPAHWLFGLLRLEAVGHNRAKGSAASRGRSAESIRPYQSSETTRAARGAYPHKMHGTFPSFLQIIFQLH